MKLTLQTLKIFRKGRDIGQKDMAARVGVSVRHLGRIERAETDPPFGLVEKICKELGLEISVAVKK